MSKQTLEKLLNSPEIHLTHSQKNFIKETYELLSIFSKQLELIVEKKFKESVTLESNKFKAGEKFFEYISQLRYPISFPKLQKLKKIKNLKNYLSNLTFEFDENLLPKKLQKELKGILNEL